MAFEAENFRALVERHQSMVYSLALRVTCDPGTAEEVAQDTFLKLYRDAQPPSNEDHLRFWLRKAATHGALDALRRRKRQPETAADEWMEQDHWTLEQSPHPELSHRLEDLLATLPEAQRVALVLRYGEDLRPEEIASVLGQPVLTVKSHLQRGLALLRRKAAISLKEYVRGT